jgi:diguanylate cyclase (GGDEF)-like protein
MPVHINGHEVCVTCSVGIAFYAGPQQKVEDLLAEADTAMYTAKAMGKNDFFVAPRAE